MYAQKSGMPFALYAYAASVLARVCARRGGAMTRDEAERLVGGLVSAHGGRALPFEGGGAAGLMLGTAEVFFEYADGELRCRALIYRFRGAPRPGVVEGFFAEERDAGRDAGGGALEYLAGSRALFLTRSYGAAVASDEFARQIERLAGASLVWGGEVLERVAGRLPRRGD